MARSVHFTSNFFKLLNSGGTDFFFHLKLHIVLILLTFYLIFDKNTILDSRHSFCVLAPF